MPEMVYDIAIVGAGAAGLMAAGAALRSGTVSVAILERNERPAKKIYATGGGRCNILNRHASPEDYRCGGDYSALPFVSAVFGLCGPEKLIEAISDMGVELTEDEDGRMYPRSFQASSAVAGLVRGAEKACMLTGFEVKGVSSETDLFRVAAADGRSVGCRRLILAGGGKAGIHFGSDGSCYKLAQSLGHRVIKPVPALTGLMCPGCGALAGVRAKAGAKLMKRAVKTGEGELCGCSSGEVQFVKDGISGICVMDISGLYRLEEGFEFFLNLDLMPELEAGALEEKLRGRREKLGGFFLEGLFPEKLAAHLAEKSAEIRSENGSDAAAKEPEEKILGRLVKKLSFPVEASRGWKEAQVSCGGVRLDEVNPETMESLLVNGLYFAGEVLDVDGPCGGYNLGWAFASGCIAGEAAAIG